MKNIDCVKCHTPLTLIKVNRTTGVRCGNCGTLNRLRSKRTGRLIKKVRTKKQVKPQRQHAETPKSSRKRAPVSSTAQCPDPDDINFAHEFQFDTEPARTLSPEPSIHAPIPANSGFMLGPYEVLREIGSGGVGMILKARDSKLKRDVAIKILRPDAHEDSDQRLRFMEEAQITGQLDHPGIAPVHMLGHDKEGREFFSMKLVAGRTLEEILFLWHEGDPATRKEFPLTRLLSVFERISETVGFAHARRVLHRDLKPANIMIGIHGEVWVLDWGLAKIMDGKVEEKKTVKPSSKIRSVREDVNRGLTMTGHTVGTPEYMAPEQACGQALDERADIFSLGAILYHMITGSSPYTGDTAQQVLSSAAMGNFTQVRRTPIGKNAPPALAAIIEKCLSKRVVNRYRNVQALVEDLRAYAEGDAVSALPESSLESIQRFTRKHQRIIKWATYAIMLGLLLVAGVASWGAHKDRQALQAQAEATQNRHRAKKAESAVQGQKDRAENAEVAREKEKARRLQAELETQKAIADSSVKARRRIKAFAPYTQAMDLLLRGQRFDQAESLFKKSLVIDPEFAEAQYSLGEVLRRQGDPLQAARAYKKASRISEAISGKPNIQALLAAGFSFDGSGMYAEAETVFREAAKVDPLNPLSMVGNVFELMHVRKLKDGLALAFNAQKAAPHLWETHFAVGCLLYESGKEGMVAPWAWRKPATEALQKAMALDSNQGEILSWLARILSSGSQEEQAESKKLFIRARQMEPLNPNRVFQQALLLYSQNQRDAAWQRLTQAKKLGLPEAHQMVFDAFVASRSGNAEKCYLAMTKALKSVPHWPSLMVNRFYAAISSKQLHKVRKDLDTWIQANPHYAISYRLKGRILSANGKHAQALQEFQKGLKIAPYHVTLLNETLYSQLILRKDKSAQVTRLRLQKVTPNLFQAQLKYLHTLTVTKRWNKARVLLQELEKNFPTRKKSLAPYREGLNK